MLSLTLSAENPITEWLHWQEITKLPHFKHLSSRWPHLPGSVSFLSTETLNWTLQRLRELEHQLLNGTLSGAEGTWKRKWEDCNHQWGIEDPKDIVSPRHSRADVHLNSQRCDSTHRAFTGPSWVPALRKGSRYDLPSLTEKLSPTDNSSQRND